jgi:hypothetical protein
MNEYVLAKSVPFFTSIVMAVPNVAVKRQINIHIMLTASLRDDLN